MGLEEPDVKLIIKQIASALEFMHEKKLVHRDVRAENILIFSFDYSKVKLTDFGLTRKAETLVKKRTRSLPTCPPEIWEAVHLEGQIKIFFFIYLSFSSPLHYLTQALENKKV